MKLGCLVILALSSFFAKSQPIALQCEHLPSPLGVDNPHPRLSWQLSDSRAGAGQAAYQITVGTDSVAVDQGRGNGWMSGRVKSSENLIAYNGRPLQPFIRYYWQVKAWNSLTGKAEISKTAAFETGMMQQANWQGSWISDEEAKETKPAPYFRKVFVAGKTIKSARAYIAAGGLYELYVNGKRIGDHVLDPMYTRFDRRNLYVTYDVTNALLSGNNAIGVLLGNGWYNHQSTAVWYFHLAPWRARPAFCMDMRITYTDGTTETISTDTRWKTAAGPLVFNSIYTGEHYDSRLEQPGWNTANFDDRKWKGAFNRSAPSTQVVSQLMYPIRHVETIPAKSISRIDDTTYLFDLGRNIAGVSKIKVQGEAGTVLRLTHTERLTKDKRHVDLSNIDIHYRPTDNQDPFQTDIFILNGKGGQEFTPRFNYKGFQYVQVTSSKPVQLHKEDLVSYFMHSDVPPAGHITSSNPIINQIWQATNNSYLSNLFGYPTDCPQREKNGWTGDANIACQTGLYNFDAFTVYEKWMADHRDEQQPNGVLPSIIPSNGWGYEWGNGPDWTSSIAIIPWELYLFYGDVKPLADNYQNIKRYVDHIDTEYPSGLTTWGLGDWVPVKSKSPVALTSSCYYYTDVIILAKAAKLLGKLSDYQHYSRLAVKIKDAVNNKYLNAEKGIYGEGLQTELAVPLYRGIVPEQLKPRVAANLSKAVEATGYHLDVGILGAKAILSALSDNGYAETAYKLAAQETYPSWGWWMKNGATTLYENWDINARSDMSLNHIMFGDIGAWLYRGIAGIKPDTGQAGFKNILLEPHFVNGLNYFKAEHAGPYGLIKSAWERSGKNVVFNVTIPAGSTAAVCFPVAGKAAITYKGKPLTAYRHLFSYAGTQLGKGVNFQIKPGAYTFMIQQDEAP